MPTAYARHGPGATPVDFKLHHYQKARTVDIGGGFGIAWWRSEQRSFSSFRSSELSQTHLKIVLLSPNRSPQERAAEVPLRSASRSDSARGTFPILRSDPAPVDSVPQGIERKP